MKKKLLVIASVYLFSINATAQKTSADNIPKVVIETLKTAYPLAEKVEWELDEENYQANFKINNREKFVKYDNKGKWLQTESPITIISIPKAVKKSINQRYNGYKIDEALKMETPNGTFYSMELSKSTLIYDVILTDQGVFTKQEQQGMQTE